MQKIRSEKEFIIRWSGILTNGQPDSLEGRDLSLYLINPLGSEISQDITVEDNTVTFRVLAGTCKVLGQYKVKLYENKGKAGQTVLDQCEGFCVVATTCQEGGSTAGLDIDTVELSGGDLAIGVQGRSAYEIAVANGFKGPEEEWLASLKGEKGDPGDPFTFEDFTPEQIQELQRPAADATNAANQAAQAASQAAQTAIEAAGTATNAAEEATTAASNATTAAQTATEAATTAAQTEAFIKQAETLRVTAEDQRKAKESERESAEESRKQAESGRVTAEQGRVSAENGRVSAEQSRASAEQQRVAEFAQIKKDAETATSNATDAAQKANEATAGINDRLSQTYANLDAIKASGETNTNKIYIDAETNTSYRYNGSEFVSIGGGASFPSRISGIKSSTFINIPYQDKYSLKYANWITIIWDLIKHPSNDIQTLIRYENNYNDYLEIQKFGQVIYLKIKNSLIDKTYSYVRPSETKEYTTWNALSINMYDLSVVRFFDGVKSEESSFSNVEDYDQSYISDIYKYIKMGGTTDKFSTFKGVLNFKITDDIAKNLYDNGLYYNYPLSYNKLANSFDWDIDNYIENMNIPSGGSYENGILKIQFSEINNNVYLDSKKVQIPSVYTNCLSEFYLKLKVISGTIDFVGFGIHGNIKANIYTSDGSFIGYGQNTLNAGEYIIKCDGATSTEANGVFLIYIKVIEPGEIELSEMKSRINGYVISCATSMINNNIVQINRNEQAVFVGDITDETIVSSTITNDNTNVISDFAGQHLIVGEDVYVATKGGQKLWKKITS